MSSARAEANAFVSEHRGEAVALGERLADLTEDTDAYLAVLTEGLAGPVSYTHLRAHET